MIENTIEKAYSGWKPLTVSICGCHLLFWGKVIHGLGFWPVVRRYVRVFWREPVAWINCVMLHSALFLILPRLDLLDYEGSFVMAVGAFPNRRTIEDWRIDISRPAFWAVFYSHLFHHLCHSFFSFHHRRLLESFSELDQTPSLIGPNKSAKKVTIRVCVESKRSKTVRSFVNKHKFK